MAGYFNAHYKHCRWCGVLYEAHKPIGKDGFHLPKCKQAHYRAYKKYVTATDQARPESTGCRRDIR